MALHFRLAVLIFSIWVTSACSLYQSEGRKFLEKEAFEFAGAAAQAHLTGCDSSPMGPHWILLQSTSLAQVYANEGDGFQLGVLPLSEDESLFNCRFQFESAQEMYEQTAAAIDLTIAHQFSTLAQSEN
ncbi:MAG: hypothetical protein AB7G93_14745 [Bdellovibrionales bacterium]